MKIVMQGVVVSTHSFIPSSDIYGGSVIAAMEQSRLMEFN